MEKVIVQSLWTKPIESNERLRDTLYIAALSLEFAHRSGYKVHMHTDSKGETLLKDYGYDKLAKTLDKIPESVPKELFAAGKFFALREEGTIGKVHVDLDVFIKKPCLDKFYNDNRIDVICQNEEDVDCYCDHDDKLRAIHILGYPPTTRPDWHGSINTGIIGINNPTLAAKYMNNYFEAVNMYTQEAFDEYKTKDEKACLLFDFILEQVELSYLSIGYNVLAILPTNNVNFVAKQIGYAHFLGHHKYDMENMDAIKAKLQELNQQLLSTAENNSNLIR